MDQFVVWAIYFSVLVFLAAVVGGVVGAVFVGMAYLFRRVMRWLRRR